MDSLQENPCNMLCTPGCAFEAGIGNMKSELATCAGKLVSSSDSVTQNMTTEKAGQRHSGKYNLGCTHHGPSDNNLEGEYTQPGCKVAAALAPVGVPGNQQRQHHEVHNPLPLPPLLPNTDCLITHVWDCSTHASTVQEIIKCAEAYIA